MSGSDTKVVLYADLLGFAALTENNELESDRIRTAERPLSLDLDTLLTTPPANPLTKTFTGFHYSLRWAIQLAQMKHALTAITFSDAAFIATTHLFEAAKLAVYLMQSLLQQRIPLRIGIASGSFSAVRFRSDIALDGGDHAAHFLGTGVVNSYRTERCGVSGLRILLHPSAHALLSDPAHNPLTLEDYIRHICCSDEERNNPENKVSVGYEIDYWHLKPTAEKDAWRALQDMWSVAPAYAVKHYEATAAAINRMRVSQGEPSLKRLRRRTLPRRNSQADNVVSSGAG